MKTTRWIALAAVAAAAIALDSSCWIPPFDPALSTSVRFEKKMEHVLTIGPIRYEGVKAKDSYFVPTYEAFPTDGYWVRREDGSRLAVDFVNTFSGDPILGPRRYFDNNNFGSLNAVQSMSRTTAASASISPTLERGIQVFGTGETINSTLSPAVIGIGLDTLAAWNTQIESSATGLSIPVGDRLLAIGGSMQLFTTNTSYRYVLLAGKITGSYSMRIVPMLTQNHGGVYSVPALGSLFLELNYPGPALAPGAFYHSDNFFATIVGRDALTGEIMGFQWSMMNWTSPPAILNFDAQITDVLHDGTLLARGIITTGAYTSSGEKLYSLPTGNYRFIHELHDGTNYYSYFSRTVVVPDNKDDWKGQVYFDVVRCPTDKLSELAD